MEAGDDLAQALQPLEELGNTYFECRVFLVLKRDGRGRLKGEAEDLELDIPVERLEEQSFLFLEESPEYPGGNLLLLPFHSARGLLLGALAFIDVPKDAQLDSTDTVSTVAALAIEQARLLRRSNRQESEMRHAWSVVRTLLPHGQREWHDYQFSGLLIPARHIGGDVYDYFPIDETRFGFLIGDATGKGVGPCVQVSTCRAYFRALAIALQDLNEIADKLNSLLNDDVRSDSFVTACFGWLCRERNELFYVNAGHSEGFLRDGRGSVSAIAEADPPLGILGGLSFTVHRQPLEPGSLLAVFTDGWTERPYAGGEYGEERLCLSLSQTVRQGVRQALRTVYQRYESDCLPHTQTDDVTALFIGRECPANR